jgi:tripartite-type tricarboxylate transporter receptor subunit TctC
MAQAYPTRPITMIIPFTPGGGSDAIGRIVGERMHMSNWYALFAPKGTPKIVIDKLNAAVVDALADPAVRTRLAEQGQELPSREQHTPEALGALQKRDIEKWWPIIRAAGMRGQ